MVGRCFWDSARRAVVRKMFYVGETLRTEPGILIKIIAETVFIVLLLVFATNCLERLQVGAERDESARLPGGGRL